MLTQGCGVLHDDDQLDVHRGEEGQCRGGGLLDPDARYEPINHNPKP